MQLLLIDHKSLTSSCTVGDVVGVYPDDHAFSFREYDIFRVVRVEMTTEEIDAIRPRYEHGAKIPENLPTYELHYSDGKITANG